MDDNNTILAAFIEPNDVFIESLERWYYSASEPVIICEMIASYGMPVGKEVFDTCIFIGQLLNTFPKMLRVTRNSVKNAVCHSSKANDANIRQALIDIYGPPGTKKNPGPTFGVTKDMWAALAVVTAYKENCKLY